jgi:hypothetical protein
VRGEEIVGGREHLVSGSQDDAVVEQPEAHRRRVGQGNVRRTGVKVRPGGAEHRRLEARAVLVQVVDGVRVETASVALDRAADRRRVRREQQSAHVRPTRSEAEKPADRGPVGRGIGFWSGGDLVEIGESGAQSREGDTGPDEKIPAIEDRHVAILQTPHFEVQDEMGARRPFFLERNR